MNWSYFVGIIFQIFWFVSAWNLDGIIPFAFNCLLILFAWKHDCILCFIFSTLRYEPNLQEMHNRVKIWANYQLQSINCAMMSNFFEQQKMSKILSLTLISIENKPKCVFLGQRSLSSIILISIQNNESCPNFHCNVV